MNKSDIIFVFSLIICSLFLSVNSLKLSKLKLKTNTAITKMATMIRSHSDHSVEKYLASKDFDRDSENLFNSVRRHHEDRITEKEIRKAVYYLCDAFQIPRPTKKEVREEFHRYDKDGNKSLDRKEFKEMIADFAREVAKEIERNQNK